MINNFDKLNKIDNIKEKDLHIQQVAGDDMTIDVVVEIFNNVNTGGTKLSKGDLAFAKICAQWSEARTEMRQIIWRLKNAGYDFELDWLLRCITVYLTGQPYFSGLGEVKTEEFKIGLRESEKLINIILNQIGSRLGLDHGKVLGSRYSIPLMVGYLKQKGPKNLKNHDWNKLLYWYIHTFLWGRYAGSTESVLAQDLNILERGEGTDGLIKQLRTMRGSLDISPMDFHGWSTGARFYPLLYLLTRTSHAKDWGSGVELSNMLLGKTSSLEVHHIFPKDILYKKGYTKSQVNALGNYAFLTKETNLEISNKAPSEYIPKYLKAQPGAVESHWMPLDDIAIYSPERYVEFLEKRKSLLAKQATSLLDSLLKETAEVPILIDDFVNRTSQTEQTMEEDDILLEVAVWMENQELDCGELNYELTDDQGNPLVIIDLAWPRGIQTGLSEPVALLLNEPPETQKVVNEHGYKFFTDVTSFKSFIQSNYLPEN